MQIMSSYLSLGVDAVFLTKMEVDSKKILGFNQFTAWR